MRALIAVETALLAQRGMMLGWAPVFLAFGIGWYFALKVEPGPDIWWAAGGVTLLAIFAARIVTPAIRPLCIALVLIICGAALAKVRTDAVDAPVLGFRYYGPIEGRVVDLDRSASDAVRITLDQVRLDNFRLERVPGRVRISLHGDQPAGTIMPGDTLMTTGHLSPPAGPAEPGGFDFQRYAFFNGIGAVGYTRNPVLRLMAADPSTWQLWLFKQRMALSRAVQRELPGEAGAFAAAIVTGDRSGMGQAAVEDLRASNLAHLVSISGLHMGLLTAFVFAVVRYGLALVPPVALRLPAKKIAAIVALCAGAGYLLLSGGDVATERSFIMVAVMLVAVLLDRRALTLRAVAIAAILVMMIEPVALFGPGFQMSFSATVALVAIFGLMKHLPLHRLPGWARAFIGVLASSAVAGMATAPYAAAHFNQISHYGLIANLLSVQIMAIFIMPAAVIAMCLAPLGLWYPALWVMEQGLRWTLFVAHQVAIQPGALSFVPSPDLRVLVVLTMGLLWLLLWKGRARWAGVPVATLTFVLWAATERPVLLVADSGALMGLMTDEGRAMSKPRGDSFVAELWLENDGAPMAQDIAAARPGFTRDDKVVTTQLGDWQILQVSGKTALADLQGCGGAAILISNQTDAGKRPCEVFDVRRLRSTGALAVSVTEGGDLFIDTARQRAGIRPWNRAGAPDTVQNDLVLSRKGTSASELADNQ